MQILNMVKTEIILSCINRLDLIFSYTFLGRTFFVRMSIHCRLARWNMFDTYNLMINFLLNKMPIDLHMLCWIMMNWILSNAYSSLVITKYPHGVVDRNSDFIQHLLEPCSFTNTMCHSSEFCFCTAPSHDRLFLTSRRK